MDVYIKHNFEDHPAFASVITRFVTNNSFQTDVKGLEEKTDRTERELKHLSKRVDTLMNKLDKLDKRVPT